MYTGQTDADPKLVSCAESDANMRPSTTRSLASPSARGRASTSVCAWSIESDIYVSAYTRSWSCGLSESGVQCIVKGVKWNDAVAVDAHTDLTMSVIRRW